jgi:hypothetical protein
MTSASTIAERVAQMHATMAADPPAEPMGAFAREQAEPVRPERGPGHGGERVPGRPRRASPMAMTRSPRPRLPAESPCWPPSASPRRCCA